MQDAVIEIKAQLEAVEARKNELEFNLAEAKAQARQGVAEQVLALIEASGFEPDEILRLITPLGRLSRKGRSARQWPRYALITDTSKTYSRGKMPGWLREAMLAVGMQPDMAEHRAQFKREYMAQIVS